MLGSFCAGFYPLRRSPPTQAWMERSLQLQREITEQRRAEGESDFICKGTLEIYDAGGLAFSQLHVGGLRMLARVLGLGTAHYPENLGETEPCVQPALDLTFSHCVFDTSAVHCSI